MADGFAIVLAGVGGSLSATGANILAWSSAQQRNSERDWSRAQSFFFYVACFMLNLTGIGLFALSCNMGGAVATVMPMQTGMNLMANMFWQMTLGLKHFDKSMRIGTLILVCAVSELAQLGPKEPDDMDVFELLKKPEASLWCAFMIIVSILGMIASYLTISQPLESLPKLCSLTSVVSFTTVIGSSVSKCFSLLSGAGLYAAVAIYFVDGVLLMGFTVVANAQCDVSLYIPAQLASQLVINMITGYLVWGDAAYIDKPLAYICVYLVMILAVYLVSPEMDTAGQILRWHRIRRTRLSSNIKPTPLGRAFYRLSELWARQSVVSRPAESLAPSLEELEGAWRQALDIGLETGAIARSEMVTLTILLLQERGFAPNATIIRWLEDDCAHYRMYAEHDPRFKQSLRDTLSAEESQKLLTFAPVARGESDMQLPLTQARE